MIFKLDNLGNFNLDYCSSQGFNFNFKTAQENTINDDVNDTKEEESVRPPHKSTNYRGSGSKERGGRGGSRGTRGLREVEVPIVVDEEMETDPHVSIES